MGREAGGGGGSCLSLRLIRVSLNWLHNVSVLSSVVSFQAKEKQMKKKIIKNREKGFL